MTFDRMIAREIAEDLAEELHNFIGGRVTHALSGPGSPGLGIVLHETLDCLGPDAAREGCREIGSRLRHFGHSPAARLLGEEMYTLGCAVSHRVADA